MLIVKDGKPFTKGGFIKDCYENSRKHSFALLAILWRGELKRYHQILSNNCNNFDFFFVILR